MTGEWPFSIRLTNMTHIKLAALFVMESGPYSNIPFIDMWGISRDARCYNGPYPVIAHPPCERWGRYWSGGPSSKVRRKLGDDNGCFKSALSSVRKWGGILEHPEGSHAFYQFGLPIPTQQGGWTDPDLYGGSSCCVAQGNYGHDSQKRTWLYLVGKSYPDLNWGPCKKNVMCENLSKRQRLLTPIPFRNLLIELTTIHE